jgi:hypothetical protein
MTLTHNPEETPPGQKASAGGSGECVRHRPMFRSQANAPCLQRSGRSCFR